VLELIKVFLLGIVEGVTEFLPISSTGHLIVAVALLRPHISVEGTFEIFIQLGAVVAVVVYFWSDLWGQARVVQRDPSVRRLWLSLILAAVPAGIVGLLLRSTIKTSLFNPVTVALALIVGGILMIAIEKWLLLPVKTTELLSVKPRQALLIGVAQIVSLIPGVSRAAASIIGGMSVGLNRQTATRFSFYLSIPTLGGATLIDLLLSLDELNSGDIVYLVLGAVVSGIVAWMAIGWLLRYIANHSFVQFGIYRIAAGVIILLLAAASVL
jgi:undecaprenyl-diphosphatase